MGTKVGVLGGAVVAVTGLTRLMEANAPHYVAYVPPPTTVAETTTTGVVVVLPVVVGGHTPTHVGDHVQGNVRPATPARKPTAPGTVPAGQAPTTTTAGIPTTQPAPQPAPTTAAPTTTTAAPPSCTTTVSGKTVCV